MENVWEFLEGTAGTSPLKSGLTNQSRDTTFKRVTEETLNEETVGRGVDKVKGANQDC